MKKRWKVASLLFVLVLGFLGLGLWGFAHSPELLDASEPVVKVDAVLALGGGADQRPFAAAALYRRGLVTKLLVPQTKDKTSQKEGLTENESTRYLRIWKKLGVPDGATEFLPGAADSTRDEAVLLGQWLDTNPEATVGIITQTWHTRRARMLFQKVLGPRASRVHFFGIVQDGYRPDGWWRIPGWGSMMFFEWLKLASQTISR